MQQSYPNCSLIVSTYNWPNALNVCLKSIALQSVLPSEIIIADDGSKDETHQLIKQYQQNYSIPIVHIWQPDEGFQLAKIRNRAIAASQFDYTIQIDGDLILHEHFVKDHIESRREGYFISGGRVLLSTEKTNQVLQKQTIDYKWLHRKSKNILNGIRNPFLRNFLLRRYKIKGKNKYYVKGCNMSFWKKDLLAVNGYNEEFNGWGREDTEIAIRLINRGIKKMFLKMGAITYHLYHQEIDRTQRIYNEELMNKAIKAKQTFCNKGLNQYL